MINKLQLMKLAIVTLIFFFINLVGQNSNSYDGKLYKFRDVKTLLYGVEDSLRNVVVPAKYDRVWIGYKENGVRVKLNGKWGMINLDGKEVIPIKYKAFKGVNFKNINVTLDFNNKYGVIDNSGNIIIPFDYDDLTFTLKLNYVFSKNSNLVGLINDKNEVLIKNEYEKLKRKVGYYGGLKNGKWSLVTRSGKLIFKDQYESITTISNTLLKIQKDGKFGLYNSVSQDEIVPPIYDELDKYKDGHLIATLNNQYGIIDTLNNVVIEMQNLKITIIPRE